MKRKVVFSESDSETEFEPEKKTKSVKKVKRIKHSDNDSILQSDCFDDEKNSRGGKIQLSLIDSLKKIASNNEHAQKPKKVKTLDSYFGPQAANTPKKKKEISVDDFFGDAEKKKQHMRTVTDEDLKTPPRMHTPVIPDTPLLDSEDLIPDTPCVPDTPKSPRTPKSKTKIESPSLSTTPKSLKTSAPSTPASVTKSEETKATPQASGAHVPFWAYQAREGPRELGTKPIPKGNPTCLKGKTFLITGILESIERDDAHALIERCGGKVMKTLGKKTDYLIVGRDAGPAKLAKVETLPTKQLDEDQFFHLIRELSHETLDSGSKTLSPPKTPLKAAHTTISSTSPGTSHCSVTSPTTATATTKIKTNRKSKSSTVDDVTEIVAEKSLTAKPVVTKLSQTDRPHSEKATSNEVIPVLSTGSELWVDKYRPSSRRTLIGQAGANSPANRLYTWLSTWHENFSSGAKARAYSSAPPWATGSADDGRWARAALLSGLPGIGKTSSAVIVCRELGFSTCELNASDCRSKRSLQEEVSQTLGMQNLKEMATAGASKLSRDRHVLIMDEVDGMAGNEDRGGMQELINMIKSSRIPVICICNDRQSPKVRSLANYCFDLRFHRPRVEQIKAALLSITCKENVTIPPPVLNDIILASNQDIRQVINNAQMWCVAKLADESQLAADASGAKKDVRLGAFDVIRKVFAPEISGQNGGPATVNECLDLFFQDYSLVPLFVQENYLNVKPNSTHGNVNKTLRLLAEASRNIATGDLVGHAIRSVGTGSWSLLPVQGIFSTVLPGHVLSGHLPGGMGPAGGVSFPGWFGKNSNQTRMRRVATELASHLTLATHGGSANPRNLLMDYASVLADNLTRPLKEGDTDSVLNSLIQYNLQREDLDSLLELATWSDRPNRMQGIDGKVKAALTRAFNKSSHLLPYAISAIGKVRAKKSSAIDHDFDDGEPNEEDLLFDAPSVEAAQDDDLQADAMIARKSTKSRGDTSSSKKTEVAAKPSSKRSQASSSSRGRGTARGPRKAAS